MDESRGENGVRWKPLLLELLVIFVGITASFWVDEWREERQDRETFHRILGEIYYDAILDESQLSGAAVLNNVALANAARLVFAEGELPVGDSLLGLLESTFFVVWFPPTVGGYERLANTPLAIPVNDVQLDLDYRYGAYLANHGSAESVVQGLVRLRDTLWAGAGVVPCRLGSDLVNTAGFTPSQIERLELTEQLAPAIAALREDGRCRAGPANIAVAEGLVREETFRIGLRRVIDARQSLASLLVGLRVGADAIRRLLEGYLPDISLPIETLGLVGSATPGDWNEADAIRMRRLGPNDWVVDVALTDGEVKFAANGEWTMNWGVPRPWTGGPAGWEFDPTTRSVAEVFPAGVARFNGANIPVEAGRYRVHFNAQSGAYRFERLD